MNKIKKKILIISFSKINSDPRVLKQIRSFLDIDEYALYTMGFGPLDLPVKNHFEIKYKKPNIYDKIRMAIQLKLLRFQSYYFSIHYVQQADSILRKEKFDLIIANDVNTLPVIVKNSSGTKIILDAHEYSPNEFENSFIWRLFLKPYMDYLCRSFLKYVDCMVTVCDSIAEEYKKNYNVVPNVITNSAPYHPELKPNPVDKNKIKIIHHGGAIRARKIENMIKMIPYLDERFELYLMLVPTEPNYLKHLKQLAKNIKRVFFIEPVDYHNICQTINKFDIGLYLLEPVNFNHKYSLPNKFFEFIQARLCIAIGPSPEMANIVKKYNLGVVSDTFKPKDLAMKINKLTAEEIFQYKQNSDKVAYELSDEVDKEKWRKIVESVLGAK